MSLPYTSLKIVAEQNTYQFVLSSCNLEVPVTFMGVKPGDEPGKDEYMNYLGAGFILSEDITIFCSNTEPTKEDENPIKLIIRKIEATEGEPTGDTAVLYGYFLEPEASGLNFYLNEEQSQSGFEYGKAGIDCSYDEESNTIILQ
ncbi:hypothetical protein [Anaeromicropila populeti]|uniref:Uncharacterized protein n=1 Tax=Anaeromicropila populeti TaxID=37658 RepID=A0A1I6ILM4_9FIRM|nr:hypothetical protein [Anaeromicropila populeti]SFR67645.1 hypothetical protein SAMN05661086_00879 [Anaeromicropila populeti]